MPGLLPHAPSDILRYLLVNKSYGTLPVAGGAWPIHIGSEPDSPDSCITLTDTESVGQGRSQIDGEQYETNGVSLRFRAYRYDVAYTKANAVAICLDTGILQNTVTISTDTYVVHSVRRLGGVFYIGRDPDSSRELFTLNCQIQVRKTN